MVLEGRNIWDLIVRRAEASPDEEMLVDEAGTRVTFGDYRHRSEAVAAGLAAEGVAADDIVSWVLPTWVESLVLVGALRRLGRRVRTRSCRSTASARSASSSAKLGPSC